MENNTVNHTFVICAYKESPYLEACIKSVIRQTSSSVVKLATSTPSDYIRKLCEKYKVEYHVRNGVSGIADDWNYAYSLADTDYVTVAHQDDIYHREYGERMISGMNNTDKPVLIAFSDYSEIKEGKELIGGLNLYIKRLLLVPIRNKKKNHERWRKRFIIRFGNSICCPSVTYNKKEIDKLLREHRRTTPFHNNFRSNLDWELWEWLSRNEGRFAFIPTVLMSHRIHEDSETTATINDNMRSDEDYEMFVRFWPKWFAGLITKAYSNSEKSNKI